MAEFDRQPLDRYVMSTRARLDHDLTEENRRMLIDARLTVKSDGVHVHRPIVELHREQPCTSDVELAERENCEFVGDIRFMVDFDYENADFSDADPPFQVGNTVAVTSDSTLAVRVRAAVREGEYADFNCNLGSRWTVAGGYTKGTVMCQDGKGCGPLIGEEGTYQANAVVSESLDPSLDYERTLEPGDSPTALGITSRVWW